VNSLRGLFVTGTDTDVGKTYISSIILRELIDAGHWVGVSKPACSGAVIEAGDTRWPDLDQLAEAAGLSDIDLVCQQKFKAPLAPPVAARLEGQQPNLSAMQENLLAWKSRADMVVVEGVGGLLCPLTDQDSIADFAAWVDFPLLIVARLGLGTINHTLLTIEAAKLRNLTIAGIILNDADGLDDTPAGMTNFAELANRTDVPVLGIVGRGGKSVSLRDLETPARIDWSGLAGSRRNKATNSD
jgi:dethiobiotin synthetase